ncbi:MAG: hypothetical protein Q7J35_19370 [Candidatus Methanoperedens sp.]|nr:hypothetical protein [Candidatus Methanoperedens sp.]
MSRNSSTLKILSIIAVLVIVTLVFSYYIQPWFQRWGATDEEIRATWPGDDLVPGSSVVYTRAITINAPPSVVWPWLVQIGQDRGGFYSYELLENILGSDTHNADRIVPEWQHLDVGNKVRIGPKEGVWANSSNIVGGIVPERFLVLITPGESPTTVSASIRGNGTWSFSLVPVDGKTTRLIIRGRRMESPNQSIGLLYGSVVDSVQFILERKMMVGIKERAEGTLNQQTDDIIQVLLWMAAFFGLIIAIILVLVQKKWKFALLIAMAAVLIIWYLCFLQPPILHGILLDFAILMALARAIWDIFST